MDKQYLKSSWEIMYIFVAGNDISEIIQPTDINNYIDRFPSTQKHLFSYGLLVVAELRIVN